MDTLHYGFHVRSGNAVALDQRNFEHSVMQIGFGATLAVLLVSESLLIAASSVDVSILCQTFQYCLPAVGSFLIEVAAGDATVGSTPAPAAGLN
jgi:hypothetical protein